MSWEQQISQLLEQLQNMTVRFDIVQQLTEAQKNQAKSNMDIGSSFTSLGGGDYRITLN